MRTTALLALLPLTLAASACTTVVCCSESTPQPVGGSAFEVVQEFPSGGPAETAWRVRYGHATAKGLFITGAWFKRSPADPWMRVLYDVRLADIFVPYHPGSPRYYDLTGFSFPLVPATEADAGCCGKILDGFVIKEVRDRGVLWKDDTAVRRGEELVLWATLDSANYNYIMQYGFRDDGTIALRLGATAANLPGMEQTAHMHNGLWRIDMDLAGAAHDTALVASHVESTGSPVASDGFLLFGNGVEGAEDWNDLAFTEIRVYDTQRQNAQGRNIAYDLRPVRMGTPRHQESFAHHDFWVTRYRAGEDLYAQLPSYANGETISDRDIVLWHISPLHHLPRSEDGREVSGVWQGVALTMWGGLDLRPRDLFDETPLHP